MTDRSLAKIDTAALLMRGGLNDMVEGAKTLLRSGLLPEQVNTPEKAVVIMLKGQELGIPPMEAMSRINVIKGKPSLSASLMAALVERAYGPKALIVEEATNDHCTVSVWKPGWDKRRTITFSMADAKQAGILSPMYQKYPRAMLRSRAISEACETHFQSIVGGLYTPEELGADPAEEDIVDYTPAVQTEVATEAKWVPVEPDSDDRVNVETGEVIEDGITEAQVRLVSRLANEKGISPEDLRDIIQTSTTTTSVGTMSKREASAVIDTLKEYERKPAPEPTPPGDGAEFFNLVRDLNKLLPESGQLPTKTADLYEIPLLKDMDTPEKRINALKRALVANLTQLITDVGDDQTQLNAIKKDWGDHAAWKAVKDHWQQAMEMAEVPV